MKKVLIVDITSLNKDGILVAHMPKVALNYYKALNDRYDVKIAGGEPYVKKYGEKIVYELPYDCGEKKKKFTARFETKLCEIINAKKSFDSKADILIFQSYSRLFPILLATLMFKRKKQKVFLIQYFTESKIGNTGKKIENLLLRLCQNKLDGIICPNDRVGQRFKFPYIVVPDYFYIEEDFQNSETVLEKYDFGLFGLMGKDKNVESIIEAFSGTNLRVLIAGRFYDEERYQKCCKNATDNITIVNKFLSDEEYDSYFQQSSIILMPYENGYNTHSSGVVLDALFHNKPILGTKVGALELVSNLSLGELYSSTEEMSKIGCIMHDNLKTYKMNIKKYLISHSNKIHELCRFIEK